MRHFLKEANLIIETFRNRPLYFLDDLLFRLWFFSHKYLFTYYPRMGWSYKCRIWTSDHVEWYIIFSWKEYDLSIFKSKKNLSILDVWWNIWLFSLYCNSLLDIQSLHIFEPSHEHKDLLLNNLKDLKSDMDVKISHLWVYDFSWKVFLTNNTSWSTDANHIVDIENPDAIEINVTTLEDLGNNNFNILKETLQNPSLK